MPTLIVYDHDVVNAVQPEVAAVKLGATQSFVVDANLSQYVETVSDGYACCDVDGLTLWTLTDDEMGQLFIDAGADTPGAWSRASVWLNRAGDKAIFYIIGTFGADRFIYLGIAPISDVGAVAQPVLTNYIRQSYSGSNLYEAVGIFERGTVAEPTSVIVMTTDFTSNKIQWHVSPSVADIEAGTYKGSHPNCTGILDSDEGPGYRITWTNDTAYRVAITEGFHDATVTDNPIGFIHDNQCYFVVTKARMEGSNGFNTYWSATRPDGGIFRVALGANEYANLGWASLATNYVSTITDDVEDVTGTAFTPTLPWTEEYTRIYDGAANDGWIASYNGRPAVHYPADGLPVLLFGVIDGNETYEDDLGSGERIFYAKVRGYKWTGAAFSQFDIKGGIVLRQGDLSYSGYNFDEPGSQGIFLIDDDIYFQICQFVGFSTSTSRSVLTRFGRFVESETRQTQGSGRVRYVPRT